MSLLTIEEFREAYLSEVNGLALDEACEEDLKSEILIEKLYSVTCSLIEGSERFNLTSIREPVEIIRKHLIDSAVPFSVIFRDDGLLGCARKGFLDVGTGAGFPLLPAAALSESRKLGIPFTGLDSTSKKIGYVAETAKKAGILAKCVSGRAEEEARGKMRSRYGMVTARAVAPLPVLLEITAGFLMNGGVMVALKGNAEQELSESENAMKMLGMELLRTVTYGYEGGENRSALVFGKTGECPAKYPRRYSEIKKRPL